MKNYEQICFSLFINFKTMQLKGGKGKEWVGSGGGGEEFLFSIFVSKTRLR